MFATPEPRSEQAAATQAGPVPSALAGAGIEGLAAPAAADQPLRIALARFREHHLAVAGLAVITFMVAFCFIGPLVYRTDQIHTNLNAQTQRPSAQHLLGTDDVGHDVLGRLMVGGQATLEVAFGAAVLAIIIGVLWGAVAGVIGGLLDGLMMRIVDTLLSVPWLLLLLFIGSILRPGKLLLIALLGLFSWLGPARFVRAETLSLREREFVQAVRLMGGGRSRVVLRHIVPNTIGTIMVNATFQVADAILAIATLSFLGLGLPPPTATWGGMLSSGLDYAFSGYWWLIYPAGIAIVLTIVAFNLLGDGLHDAFEVRLRD